MYVCTYARMYVRTYVRYVARYVIDDYWYDLAFHAVAILAYLFNINLETKLPLQYILFTLVSTLQVIVLCRHAVVATFRSHNRNACIIFKPKIQMNSHT